MSDFPRIELAAALTRHGRLNTPEENQRDRDAIDRAVTAYDQLAERLVMDATKHSLEVADLRYVVGELRRQLAEARRAS